MKRVLYLILCFLYVACDVVTAAPGDKFTFWKKPSVEMPSQVRIYVQGDKGPMYCGTPYKDGILTCSHTGPHVGTVLLCEGHIRTVTSVHLIIVPTISGPGGDAKGKISNRHGDLAFLTLNEPLPSSVRRAELAKPGPAGVCKVLNQHGRPIPRFIAPKGPQTVPPNPDHANPRWTYLAGGQPLVPGDSGAPVIDDKGKLRGILSRIGGGQCANLVHPEVSIHLP